MNLTDEKYLECRAKPIEFIHVGFNKLKIASKKD